jgi:hypothetical protein
MAGCLRMMQGGACAEEPLAEVSAVVPSASAPSWFADKGAPTELALLKTRLLQARSIASTCTHLPCALAAAHQPCLQDGSLSTKCARTFVLGGSFGTTKWERALVGTGLSGNGPVW